MSVCHVVTIGTRLECSSIYCTSEDVKVTTSAGTKTVTFVDFHTFSQGCFVHKPYLSVHMQDSASFWCRFSPMFKSAGVGVDLSMDVLVQPKVSVELLIYKAVVYTCISKKQCKKQHICD